MVKVLHAVSNISIRSGIMSVLMNYYRNMDHSVVQFGFLYYDERQATYEKEILDCGGKVYKIPRSTNLFAFQKALKEFCSEHYGKYQILHIHDVFMTIFYMNFWRKAGLKKLIVHSHATKFSDHKLGEIRNRIFSTVNYFVPDYYFACSKMAGEKIFGKRFDRDGVVINNAIDLKKFYPDNEISIMVKKELGIDNKFVIGHIGNFTLPKNHFFLLDIFQYIAAEREDTVLVLVGDGELRNAVLQKAVAMGINEKILYLGTRDDVDRIIHCFDCFLFPSNYEGLGIVLIEAQASGIPCIFSDVVPVEANILKKSNQILSLKSDRTEWARAVLRNMTVKPEYKSQCHTDTIYGRECEVTANEFVKKQLVKAGFNIEREAEKLQQRYVRMVEKLK